MKTHLSLIAFFLISLQSPTNAIGYGKVADPSEFGWHVRVEFKFLGEYKTLGKRFPILYTVLCGGVLISKEFVLTARHCVVPPTPPLGRTQNYTLILGAYDLKKKNLLRVKPIKIILHPDEYDLALLRLPKGLMFDNRTKPIDLPPSNLSIRDIDEREGYLSGFGQDEKNEFYTKLRYAMLLIVSKVYLKCFGAEFICAQSSKFKVIRTGDSGGGLVFRNRKTNKFFVVGIASQTFPDEMTGRFIAVDEFLDWIGETTGLKTREYSFLLDQKRPPIPEFTGLSFWFNRYLAWFKNMWDGMKNAYDALYTAFYKLIELLIPN